MKAIKCLLLDSQTSYHSPNVWVQDSDVEVSSQDSIVTLVPVENQSPLQEQAFDMLASAVTMDMTRKTIGINGRHSLPSTHMSSCWANSIKSLRRHRTIP